MKLLIDEDLSPLLAARCAEKGIYAAAVVHVGLSSRKDRDLWRYAFENDFIVVTINARDFVNLIQDEVHPGLIILREGDLSRDEQWSRLKLALDYILRHDDPAGSMVNRFVEVRSATDILIREIPPAEA